MSDKGGEAGKPFQLEEATIDDLHRAIRAGETTLVAVVQHYIDRARAFNGVASVLVTEDGAPIPKAEGAVRAGSSLDFPTATVKGTTILPDLDKYRGPPLEFGRMEADRFRPECAAAIRHDIRDPERHSAECARHIEHPRRALGDLSRRI